MPEATTPAPARDIRVLWRWLIPLAVLVVALFVFVFWSVLFVKHAALRDYGRYAIECRQPKGAVSQYTSFQSRGGKPAGGWFRFEVFDVDAPEKPVLSADHLAETRWMPSPSELAHLPARIRWRIAAVDPEGIERDADETSAWLDTAPKH